MADSVAIALQYANKNYHVFPLAPRSKKPKKGTNGLKDATIDLGVIQKIFGPDDNIAIRTGKDSGEGGVWVLDVDPDKGGLDSYSKLLEEHGKIPATPTQKTGGGGFHYFFAMPRGIEIRNRTGVLPGLDVRGEDGYVVAPYSIHPVTGAEYEWIEGSSLFHVDPVDAPSWLVDLVTVKLDREAVQAAIASYDPNGHADKFEREEIVAALNAMDADSDFENFGHDKHGYAAWRDIGMAIHWEFGDLDGFEVWDKWCSAGSQGKYEKMAPLNMWKSFHPVKRLEAGASPCTKGTIFGAARDCFGWTGEVDLEKRFESFMAKPREDDVEVPRPPSVVDTSDLTFDIKLLTVDGFLGAVSSWIRNSGFMSPHELALAGSISALSALAGRKFKTPTGGGLGIFIAGIAPSSAGKNAALSMIGNLLASCDLSDYVGGSSATSDSAIHDALVRSPSQVMLWDEIGEKFAAMTDARRGSRTFGAVSKLLTVWSSGCAIMCDKDMSNRAGHIRKREDIVEPNLALYGVATPISMRRALQAGDVVNGFLPRFLLFNVTSNPMPYMSADETPPDELVQYVRRFMRDITPKPKTFTISGMDTGISLDGSGMRPQKRTVPWTDEAMKRFRQLFIDYLEIQRKAEARLDDVTAAVYGKLAENLLRLATLRAISMHPRGPEVTIEDIEWGREIAEKSCSVGITFCKGMAGNDYEHSLVKIEEIIKRASIEGDGISQRDLTRKSRWLKKRERNEILSALLDIGAIWPRVVGRKTCLMHSEVIPVPEPTKSDETVSE